MAGESVTNSSIRAENLTGLDVWDSSGEKVGVVEGAYVDTDGSETRYVAIRTGWFGMRRHVVPMEDLAVDYDLNALRLPYDRDQLSSGPTVDENGDDLSHDDERNIYQHYGRTGYWEAVEAKQTTPSATPEIAQADVAAAMAESTASRSSVADPDERRVRWHDPR